MSNVRTFVVGDIHGNYKGFMQALERADFDYNNDQLISLGDIADGYSEVPEIIEEFIKIKNLIWCLGNHDKWTQEWFSGEMNMAGVNVDGYYSRPSSYISPEADVWLTQGGRATYTAYVMRRPELISKHRDFWIKKPQLYYEDLRDQVSGNSHIVLSTIKRVFVHGGFNRGLTIDYQSKKSPHILYWDRDLWYTALRIGPTGMSLDTEDHFDEIFIGHTSTQFQGVTNPMKCCNVWNLDTGGGWTGKVTVMNVDTKEYYQSDLTEELYPNERPRK